MIASSIEITSNGPVSSDLYKSFSKKIKNEFKRIGVFYVGQEAEDKLDAGWRLVSNVNSPEGYDLVKS